MQTSRRQLVTFTSLAVLTLALPVSASAAKPSAATPSAAKAITWMISSSAIGHLKSLKPPPPQGLLTKAFSDAFVMGTPIGLGLPVKTYTSYLTLKADVAAKKLPGPYLGVLLDLESWPFTPMDEQLNPAKFERLAGKLVHSLLLKA